MKASILAGIGFAATSSMAMATTVSTVGSGLPFDNMQPSLAITQAVALSGLYPSRSGSGGAQGGTLGFVYQFASNFAPGSSAMAAGQLLPIASNTALFSLLGTTYGGNGTTNFALPNLTGRATLGAFGSYLPGEVVGSPTATLSVAQMPAHDHTVPSGGTTSATGGALPVSNMQPSLGLLPVIATSGSWPGSSSAFLGQVATFAGTFAPTGWAVADGSLLPIAGNTALYSLIGTTYGGNGTTTFALPNLIDRVAVGADPLHLLGSTYGADFTTVSSAQLPAHDHDIGGTDVTGTSGASQPVSNYQSSLALNYLIALQGIFPSYGGGGGFDSDSPLLGQIVGTASGYVPDGWALAQGQLLPIRGNEALFAILGTMYGGDGWTNFALPDLRGRTIIGNGIGYMTGGVYGTASITLTEANLPAHTHMLPDVAPPDGGGTVPEPMTVALLAIGLFGMSVMRRHGGAQRARIAARR